MLNSINCSTVIHLHIVILMLLREATSETYGPRVYLPSYYFSYLLAIYAAFYFAIFIFQSIKQKYKKYLSYYLYQISLLQVAVKGLTTPLSHWLQGSYLFVQVRGTCV